MARQKPINKIVIPIIWKHSVTKFEPKYLSFSVFAILSLIHCHIQAFYLDAIS